MYRWLLAGLLLVPVIEVWGILKVGGMLGGWNTLLILIAMGLAGAWLARTEGRKVWRDAQLQIQAGQMPGIALIDGICVLLGGLLLLFPGFFSDIIGLVIILPITRPYFRHLILQWLEKRMRSGHFTIRRF